MTDGDAIAIITGSLGLIGTVLTVLVLFRTGRTESKTSAILENVQNDHPKNMRVEGDERHEENTEKLDALLKKQSNQGAQIDVIFKEVTRLATADEGHELRLRVIEDTQPRSPFMPKARHLAEPE